MGTRSKAPDRPAPRLTRSRREPVTYHGGAGLVTRNRKGQPQMRVPIPGSRRTMNVGIAADGPRDKSTYQYS